jgi:hypothetical protein
VDGRTNLKFVFDLVTCASGKYVDNDRGLHSSYLNDHDGFRSLSLHLVPLCPTMPGPPASTDDRASPPTSGHTSRCRRIYDELVKDLRYCPKRKQDRKNLEGFTSVVFSFSSSSYPDLNIEGSNCRSSKVWGDGSPGMSTHSLASCLS